MRLAKVNYMTDPAVLGTLSLMMYVCDRLLARFLVVFEWDFLIDNSTVMT